MNATPTIQAMLVPTINYSIWLGMREINQEGEELGGVFLCINKSVPSYLSCVLCPILNKLKDYLKYKAKCKVLAVSISEECREAYKNSIQVFFLQHSSSNSPLSSLSRTDKSVDDECPKEGYHDPEVESRGPDHERPAPCNGASDREYLQKEDTSVGEE